MRQRGVSLVEVLVAMVILAIGLLGLLGLQGRLQVLQVESYQRAQAVLLMQDMANRIAVNRNAAAAYATHNTAGIGTALGDGMTCPTANTSRVERDRREWCLALQGAAESLNSNNVGAMIGGRGCVQDLGGNEYMVMVAWQGLAPVSAPPASVVCGLNAYDGGAGSVCVNDLCRRVVTTVVRIATL
jgi:type IV pilus assembly protein PilV